MRLNSITNKPQKFNKKKKFIPKFFWSEGVYFFKFSTRNMFILINELNNKI